MSYYGRTKYGNSGSYRRSGGLGSRSAYNPVKKVSSLRKGTRVKKYKTKFAMQGFARDTETKYFDRSLSGDGKVETEGIGPAGLINTINYSSGVWTNYSFTGSPAAPTVGNTSNDLVKYIPNGAGVSNRIGNRIYVKYIKGNITFTANTVQTAATELDQHGEEAVDSAITELSTQYLRTTIKYAIVRDLMVNNPTTTVGWSDVFASGNPDSNVAFTNSGVHAELNINNMGRFRVLKSEMFQLDADDPQKTCMFNISDFGTVRYNASAAPSTGIGTAIALTDTGCYLIWAAITAGNGNATVSNMPPPVCNVRVCFTDA